MRLCRALGLEGRMHGANYWVKDPRRSDGGNYTSFSIETRRGFYKNFAEPDEGGDLINLIAVMQCGGDNARAIRWALDWLGLSDGSIAPSPKEAAALAQKRREDEEHERAREAGHRATARRIWLDAHRLTGFDPASLYLANRNIDVTKLVDGPPGALRFAPDCLAMPENIRLPAMLANVSGRGGQIATHRTYLDCTSGVWTKAFRGQVRDGKPVSAKRVLGKYAGGSIRLTKGKSGKALALAKGGEWVMIAEGVENALTAALAKPDLRALSAVALSNLANVELPPPPEIAGVVIIADNDSKAGAAMALDRAVERYQARGYEVAIIRADEAFKDFNDYLKGNVRG